MTFSRCHCGIVLFFLSNAIKANRAEIRAFSISGLRFALCASSSFKNVIAAFGAGQYVDLVVSPLTPKFKRLR